MPVPVSKPEKTTLGPAHTFSGKFITIELNIIYKGGECNDAKSDFIHGCVWPKIMQNDLQEKIIQCSGKYFLLEIPANSKHVELRH